MTETIIFDFGRVLVQFETEEMTKHYIHDPADVQLAAPIIFDRLYWDRSDEGTMTDEEIKDAFCKRLPERLRKGSCEVMDHWYLHLTPIEEMAQLVRDLKSQGKKLYLLSNISNNFADGYTQNPSLKALLELFDGLVFSAKIHMVKPHREIFEYLLNRYELQPNECTFIDDNPANVNTAKELGMQVYLFDGSAEKLRTFLYR
ncbi:MAG: HAD family phosphatase [Clostridia bacterium]|nr:HAD family phosphatase [Clostridia bacterium]